MRASMAGTGEAEPTVLDRQAKMYDVLVAMIKTGYQTIPPVGGDDLPLFIDSVTMP